MFTRIWSGFSNRLEGFFGGHTCQKGKGNLMRSLLVVIAFLLVYICSFDRFERLKGMQELARCLQYLLEFFSKR